MKYLVPFCVLLTVGLARPQFPYDHPIYQGPNAPIGHDGRVIDTPEVAEAKNAHFAAYAKEAARARSYDESENQEDDDYDDDGSRSSYQAAPHVSSALYSAPTQFSNRVHHYADHRGYDGPAAPLNHEGRVIDTPEVAQAKAAHFAAYNHAATRYHGVPSVPHPAHLPHQSPGHRGYAPLAHDGRVIDTPEVARAKAAHLAAHAKALSHAHGPAYYNNYY